jgi:fermentation-respiration switch protein FrsA (DUF1100 family)
MGQSLFDAARPPKDFLAVTDADHNDLYILAGNEYKERIQQFISGVTASDT